MVRRSYVQKVLYSIAPMLRQFCSEGFMFRKSHVQKLLFAVAPMLRMSSIKKKRNRTKSATRRGTRCGARNNDATRCGARNNDATRATNSKQQLRKKRQEEYVKQDAATDVPYDAEK